MNYSKILNDKLKRTFIFPKFQKVYKLRNGLIIPNRNMKINRDYRMEYVLAYDSETYKGKCKLLCRNEGKLKYIMNPSFKQCLDFLYYKSSKRNGYRFFFNIDFDITAILKTLPQNKKNLKFIDDLSKGITVIYENYKLQWIRTKLFQIKRLNDKNKSKALFFSDLYTFFKMGLNKVAKEYLNKQKKDNIDAEKLNTSLKYWNKNEKDIIKYCIKDCELTAKVGIYLINACQESLKCLPRILVSPASLSKHFFRLNCILNRISDIPKKIIQISYNCYHGGKFELLKRGYFKKLWIYDINSEYPESEKKFPDLSNGVWYKFKKNKLPKKETFGYFDVLLDIPNNNLISTIPFHKKNEVLKYPNGKVWIWATWYDLDLIRKYIIKIRRGYIFLPKKNNIPPLKEAIDFLFDIKARNKRISKILYEIGKLTMNSYYGCTIEQHENWNELSNEFIKKAGILFNPVYASQITARGRWQILKPIPLKIWNNLAGFHTDSIMSEISLDKYLPISNEIGHWSNETLNLKNKESIILNTGMYQVGHNNYKMDDNNNFILDDDGNKICIDIIKTRGIPKQFINNWFDFCEKHKNLNEKKFIIRHMVKIREAIVHKNKYTFNDVNIFDDIEKTVSVKNDDKRSWKGSFKNFRDLSSRYIESFPLIKEINNDKLKYNYI